MIVCSAKVIRSSLIAFCWFFFRTGGKRFSYIMSLGFCGFSLIGFVSMRLLHPEIHASKAIFMAVTFGIIPVGIAMLISMFALCVYIWPGQWTFGEVDMMAETLFGKKRFDYEQIELIVLTGKFNATILVSDGMGMRRVLLWFGKNQAEWIDFIKFLSAKNIRVEDLISVRVFEGLKTKYIKMSALDAYSAILKSENRFS